jgi:hypothetical protein
MEMYGLLSEQYPGWSLKEVRELSMRERVNWLNKAVNKVRR